MTANGAAMVRVSYLHKSFGELKVLKGNRARAFYESLGMGATTEVTYVLRERALIDLAEEDSSARE